MNRQGQPAHVSGTCLPQVAYLPQPGNELEGRAILVSRRRAARATVNLVSPGCGKLDTVRLDSGEKAGPFTSP